MYAIYLALWLSVTQNKYSDLLQLHSDREKKKEVGREKNKKIILLYISNLVYRENRI